MPTLHVTFLELSLCITSSTWNSHIIQKSYVIDSLLIAIAAARDGMVQYITPLYNAYKSTHSEGDKKLLMETLKNLMSHGAANPSVASQIGEQVAKFTPEDFKTFQNYQRIPQTFSKGKWEQVVFICARYVYRIYQWACCGWSVGNTALVCQVSTVANIQFDASPCIFYHAGCRACWSCRTNASSY